MTIAKYHHLVPITYIKPWCYENDSVYVIDKKTKKITSKNINNHYGKLNFHSLKAGMPNLLEEDMKKIFEPLDNYCVYLEGNELKDYKSKNNSYYSFDKWRIEKDGELISKKEKNILKSTIENKKIIDIENSWNTKYETRWNSFRDDLIYRVLNSSETSIDAVNKGFLIKFIVGMNWRGFSGNEDFKQVYDFISKETGLNKIHIPHNERDKKYLETADKEMENHLLLKYYRDFLNDKGFIYASAKQYIKFMTIKFYIASEKLEFVTSDNPSFWFKNTDGKNAHIMPLSPKVLASVIRDEGNSDRYFIAYLNNQDIKKINDVIYEKAQRDIIISEQNKNWISNK